MNCRHCSAPMEEGTLICPTCGGDNSGPVRNNNWKKILVITVAAVILVGALAAVFFGFQGSVTGPGPKSSYTAGDARLKSAMDTVVATAGDLELTNGELQIAYWSMIYDFLNYYGDYAAYMVDLSKPLDQQTVPDSEMTWQQYFLEMALTSWRRYSLLAADAQAAGVEMSDTLKDHFDGMYEDMKGILGTYGFETVEELLANDFGVGCDYADYENYMKAYYYGGEYYNYLAEHMTVTDDQVEAYYASREQEFVSSGYGKDAGNMVDVRHILLSPNEKKTAGQDIFTEEEWADCLTRAQALLAQWETNGTQEYFAELAKEHSTCPSKNQGGLIENIMKGQMVEEFEDWIMEDHEFGDYGLVKTMYGYHIIFYVGGSPIWYEVSRSNYISDAMSEHMKQREDAYPLTVDYGKIWLSELSLVG